MQYSIINLTNTHKLRIDAEYYHPIYLNIQDILATQKTTPLEEYSYFVKKGIFDISPEKYKEEGIPLIRTSEIKDPLIDFSSTVFIDDETQREFSNTELSSGDLVFTKIGAYIGDVSYLPSTYSNSNVYVTFLLFPFSSRTKSSEKVILPSLADTFFIAL